MISAILLLFLSSKRILSFVTWLFSFTQSQKWKSF
jgi:hypothetical protein